MCNLVIDQMDMPDLGDEADAPIIVPKPGQILRRSARTKIRKPGQTGEGAHRFQTSRSRRISNPRDGSPNTHPDQETPPQDPDPRLLGLNGPGAPTTATARPESFSDETFIYDAYAADDPADTVPVLVSQPPPDEGSPSPPSVTEFEPQYPSRIQPHNIPIPPAPTLHHPQPQHQLAPTNEPQYPSRTPSPGASSVTLVEVPQRSPESHHTTPTSSPPPPQDRKEKEKGKKGGFFGWGGEKGKKGSKEKEKEKDSSFLGSLFGGSKKKQEEYTGTGLGSGSGRETAAALLGASKSKSRAPSPTPQAGGPYARYPIHVERAIYRLSHIKLANPRRPLYEQVLISNLMFWYLGVINNKGQTNGAGQNQNQPKESQQQHQQQQQETGQHPQGGEDTHPNLEKEGNEQEDREKAERERIEAEKEWEKEREREKELQAQQQQQAQRREQKRGPLTKPAPGPPGQRKAEMPVRGPQYEMQHRVMEQEYGGYDPRNQPQNRPGPMSYNPSPQPAQPQPQMANNTMYYNPGNPQGTNNPSQRTSSPQLPPGAMPPMNPDQSQWNNQVRFRFTQNTLLYLNPTSELFFAGWPKEVQVTAPDLVRPESNDGKGCSWSYTLEIPLCQCHPAADGREPWVSTPTEWETQEGNKCSCGHEPCTERRGRISVGDVATTTTAEITPRDTGSLRSPSLIAHSLFFSFWMYLLVLFCIPLPTRLPSLRPSPPHHVCYFACDSHPKRSPTSLPPFGTIFYSTFNDLLQSSLGSHSPPSSPPRTLATLFSFISFFFPTYVTLSSRSSIYFSVAGVFFLLPCAFSFHFGVASVDEFFWRRSFGRLNMYMEIKFEIV